jgi:hypothetical protein
MSYLIRIAIFLIILSACSTNRYQLLNSGVEKDHLINYIKNLSDSGKIPTITPLIILDGKFYRHNVELKKSTLKLTKEEIKQIKVMNQVDAIQTYGKVAQNGVVLITTYTKNKKKDISKPKLVLILLNGEKITQDQLKTVDTSNISSIKRLTSQTEIKKHTSEKCDALILITLKK